MTKDEFTSLITSNKYQFTQYYNPYDTQDKYCRDLGKLREWLIIDKSTDDVFYVLTPISYCDLARKHVMVRVRSPLYSVCDEGSNIGIGIHNIFPIWIMDPFGNYKRT